mgnify:CR=1 FL=1
MTERLYSVSLPRTLQWAINWLSTHWFLVFVISVGVWVWLPWLAPFLMAHGWTAIAKAIYSFYSFFCHQLPQRSYFFYGQKMSYSLTEIQAVWMDTNNPLLLRRFIGSPQMGWKIAWSDRMIAFYGGIWLFGLLWGLLRDKMKQLPWWGFLTLLLPMVFDGTTHLISDLAGIGQGFRDSNHWLAIWTNHAFPASFYAGEAFGSFNSWARLITGLLGSLGIVWSVFPILERWIKGEGVVERNVPDERGSSQNSRLIGR